MRSRPATHATHHDGVSIADDVFRGGCIQPTGLAVSGDGTVTVSMFTGGVLVGRHS